MTNDNNLNIEKNKENVSKNVPELRFQGFVDAWELRKLGDLAEIKDSARIPNIKWQKEGVPYLRSSDLSSEHIKDGLFLSLADYMKYDKITGSPKKGDLIFASGGDIGLAIYKHDSLPIYVQGGSILYVKTSKCENLDGLFLKYSFASPKVKKYIRNASTGTSLKHFVLKPANALPISYPDLIEQEKIGSLLMQMDRTITLHQRKLDKLKRLKQGYLQQLFPKNDEKVPRVRFANFEHEWELRKLGRIAKITMGQSPNSENYTTNPDDYILVQGNADMKNGRVFPRVWTTQITKIAEKNDLILSVRAPVGDIGKTDYNVVLGRGVAAIKGNEFIFQMLGKMKQNGYWTKLSTGSTFESINSVDIKETQILLPTGKEQIQIGSFFKLLDNTISLHQSKLDKLKSIKQAFLQKMFI